MSELPSVRDITSEVVVSLRPVEQEHAGLRFAGLSLEKALSVAERYLAPVDVEAYLRPFLGELRMISSIAHERGEDPTTVERYIQKLEVKLAEAHLANIPRGYGHTAALLTIVRDKESA